MKKTITIFLLALAAASCTLAEIPYVEGIPSGGEETAIVTDCTEFNADIAVLQVLAAELLSGSCVMSVDGSSIEFDSGTTATVTVRDSYGFSYVNPTVSVSGRYWVIDGTALDAKLADALLQLKCDDGSWYYSLDGGSSWSYYADAETGADVPVFTSMTAGEAELSVTLGSGSVFTFDYCEQP